MKPSPAFASLLLALVFPVASGVAAPPLPPGSYGLIGFAFFQLVSHLQDVDKDKIITKVDNAKQAITNLVKQDLETAFTNRSFITDYLQDHPDLPGPVTDWGIQYVEVNYPPSAPSFSRSLNPKIRINGFKGFVLIHKGGDVVRYVGGPDTPGLPISWSSNKVSVRNESAQLTVKRADSVDINSKITGRYNSTESYTMTFKPALTGNAFSLHGILHNQGNYNIYTDEKDSGNNSSRYTSNGMTLDTLSGDDGDSVILTGEIRVGILHKIPPSLIQTIIQAYIDAINPT